MGTNTADYSAAPGAVTVDLSQDEASDDGYGDTDILRWMDDVVGSAGNDSITGNDRRNTLAGGPGDDTLLGGGHNDELHGQDGKDTLDGGTGSDVIAGGTGDDTVRVGPGKDVADGQPDTDTAHVARTLDMALTVTIAGGFDSQFSHIAVDGSDTSLENFENIIFGDGSVVIDPADFVVAIAPQYGTVNLVGGVATYTPDGGTNTVDFFIIEATSASGDVVRATIALKATVPAVPDLTFGSGTTAVVVDGDGTEVTLLLSGQGRGEVFIGGDGYIECVRVTGATGDSRLIILTNRDGDGRTRIERIEVTGDLNELYAPQVDLDGRLMVSGEIDRATLGNVIGASTMRFGGSVNSRATWLTFGRAQDLDLVSGAPIMGLTVIELLDVDANEEKIVAPYIGWIYAIGAAGIAGNFQANLELSGAGLAAGAAVLGGATVGGEIACLWDIEGSTGAIMAGSTGATWILDAEGVVRGIECTDTLGGTITALYFDWIYTWGGITAVIATDGAHATSGKSIGTLTAKSAQDVSITVPGGIGSISLTDCVSTDEVEETITAAWINWLRTWGGAASDGNFQANLTLSGAGLAAGAAVLGEATVEGEIACLWDIEGSTGAIMAGSTGATWILDAEGVVRGIECTDTLGGTITALYFDWIYTWGGITAVIATDGAHATSGKSIGTLTAKSAQDVSITVPGGIGSISLTDCISTDEVEETITAAWIEWLRTWGTAGSDGDFQVDLELSGAGLAAGADVLGEATVEGTWKVKACGIIGNVGTVSVGSMEGKLLLGCDELDGNQADFNEGKFTLRSLTIRGIDGEYFRIDSKLGAWEIGSLIFAGEEPEPSGTIEYHEVLRSRNVPGQEFLPLGGQYILFVV